LLILLAIEACGLFLASRYEPCLKAKPLEYVVGYAKVEGLCQKERINQKHESVLESMAF
jgi:hypothetical protein